MYLVSAWLLKIFLCFQRSLTKIIDYLLSWISKIRDLRMATQRIGIIMHGVTGRMGYNQHLGRSIQAIIQDGGLLLSNGDRLLPDPILVGRNGKKMEALAKEQGIARWSDSIEQCLANTEDKLFFDAGTT